MLALLLTLAVGLFVLVGTIIGKILKNNQKIINFSICLSFGVILALATLELFPEIVETLVIDFGIEGGIFAFICIVLGFIILYQLDSLIPHHETKDHTHHHQNSNCSNEHLKHIGIVTSIALILHNIIEGMSLFVATTNETKVGFMLCIGIGLHNIPMGLMIESTLRNEYKWRKILVISLLVSLSTVLGGLTALTITTSDLLIGLLLSVTLGMLIYIAFAELLPQITAIDDKKVKYVGLLTGIIILWISLIFG